jgi:hypothetical protein
MLCLADGLNHHGFLLVQAPVPIGDCGWQQFLKVPLTALQEPTEALLLKMAVGGQGLINATLPH